MLSYSLVISKRLPWMNMALRKIGNILKSSQEKNAILKSQQK